MTLIGNHVLSMTRGEVTPLVHARRDLEDYRRSLAECTNFKVLKYGGSTRIPGTLDLAETSTGGTARLIPFVFNKAQSYALEFSNYDLRIFTEDGLVSGVGTITTPYPLEDVWDIQIESIGDLIYITCEGHKQRVLTRNSATSWTLATYTADDGPFLPLAKSGKLDFSGEGGFATPQMTSNTAPSGYTAVDNKASTEAYKVFNRFASQFSVVDNGAGWIYFDFGSGDKKTLKGYAVQGTERGSDAPSVPVSWVLQGRTLASGSWFVLDSQKLVSDWLPGETRLFTIDNSQGSSQQIRFKWLGGGNSDPESTVLGELMLLEDPETQSRTDVDANITDINGGDGLTAADVNRYIRAMGGDGYWRVLRIYSVSATDTFEVVVMGPAPLDPATLSGGTHLFQMGAWGYVPGYPQAVFKHLGRLGFANTDAEPRSFWMTQVGNYDDMGTSQPLVDDDAITGTLDSGEVDHILWGASNNADLMLGTAGGIRVIGKRDDAEPFGPSNFEEIGSTRIPVSSVRPVFSGLMMLFADAARKRVYETGFSRDEGGYISRELTVLAEHIFRGQIKEMHFQITPDPTLWAVLENGEVAVCTYDRHQQIFGVGRMRIPGTQAKVQSMCILPTPTTDIPMFVTRRQIDGSPSFRVERMADMFREDDLGEFAYPIYFMGASVYDGSATSTITGLSHLEGETVGVYDITNGIDLGDAVVNGSGNITVPGGGTVVYALVGLRYTSRGKTLPPPNAPEDGRDTAHDMVPIRATVDVYQTYGLTVGGDNHMHPLATESDAILAPASPEMHTGVVEAPLEEGWDTLHQITFETDRAYPATIRSINVEFDRGG